MPPDCSGLEQAYWNAYNADRAADLSVSSAENNLTAAYWAYAAGIAAEIGCAFTAPTIALFLLCESAALSATEAAAFWIESAEDGLEAAEINAGLSEGAMDAAHAAWCACVG